MRLLVTGCSSGIGRDVACYLASRGHEVIATARRVEQIADIQVALRLSLDVTDQDAIASAIAAAGPIDGLVNNAGFSLWSPAELVPHAIEDRIIATNLLGPIRMARACLPQMRKRGFGRIIQVSSVAAHAKRPLLGHYAATKAALETMSDALRAEVAAFGIGVTTIAVGAVESSVDDKRIVFDGAATPYAGIAAAAIEAMSAVRSDQLPARRVSEAIAEALEAATPMERVTVAPPRA